MDFLLSNESKMNFKVFPVEVKSSKKYTMLSLDRFKERFGKKVGKSIIIHTSQYSETPDTVKYPPYMVFCLFDN